MRAMLRTYLEEEGKMMTTATALILRGKKLRNRVCDAFESKKKTNFVTENLKNYLSTERFTVPETLFSPKATGLQQCGLVEAIVQAIETCDSHFAALYQNVLLIVGITKVPNFRDRVEADLRKLVPNQYMARVVLPEDPIEYTWKGAHQFAFSPDYLHTFCVEKFAWGKSDKANKGQNAWVELQNKFVFKG